MTGTISGGWHLELGAGIWNWVLGFRTGGWCLYLGLAFGTGVWDLELGVQVSTGAGTDTWGGIWNWEQGSGTWGRYSGLGFGTRGWDLELGAGV